MPSQTIPVSELPKTLHALACKLIPTSTSVCLSLLQSCIFHRQKALPFVTQLQAHITHHQIPLSGLLGDYLVSALAKCGSLHDALFIFSQLPCVTVFSVTALISAYTDSGLPHHALSFYQSVQEQGIQPSIYTVVSLFKACGAAADLCQGMVFHADAVVYGFVLDGFVGNTLISMYGKCTAIDEAEHVFNRLYKRDNVSWNAMLSAFVENKEGEKALLLFVQMQDENIRPDRPTYIATLQACSILAEEVGASVNSHEVIPLEIGYMLHSDIHQNGFAHNINVNSTLIRMYGKCGAVMEAENVFCHLLRHDVISYSAMLSAYVERGNGEKALWLYRQLHEEGVNRDLLIEVLALQACVTLIQNQEACAVSREGLCIELGQALHAQARRGGFHTDVSFTNHLISLYGKCGAIREAMHAFSMSSQHSISTWNSLLCAIVDHGHGDLALQLYSLIQKAAVNPDQQTYIIVLQACALFAEMENSGFPEYGQSRKVESLEIGRSLHMDAGARGFASDAYVCNATLSLLVKCEAFPEAEDMFCGLVHRNIVSWTVMLWAYVEQGEGVTALLLYRQMQKEAADCLDELTFVMAFQACICLTEKEDVACREMLPSKRISLEIGQALHGDVCRQGLLSSIMVMSALISMYSKCSTVIETEIMFSAVMECANGSWSVILTSYVEHGEAEKALLWYSQMQREGKLADQITFAAALQACAILAEKEGTETANGFSTRVVALEVGRALHTDAHKQGYASNIYVTSALISMYGKCGAIEEAEAAFEGLPQKSNVPWNAMLSMYARQGLDGRVISLYKLLRTQRFPLEAVTLMTTLQGIGTTASLDMCKGLHFDIVCAGYDQLSCMVSALLHAYGSCASMVDVWDVFENLQTPDIVSWNACIAGHVGEGKAAVASMSLFKELNSFNVKPNRVSFLTILSACGHAGLLIEGLEYFISMSMDYGFNPDTKHYGSLMDLLGRAGDFKRLEDLLGKMPIQPNLTIWSCLLGACQSHVNLELAQLVFHGAMQFDPKESTPYVLMSNICTKAESGESALPVTHLLG